MDIQQKTLELIDIFDDYTGIPVKEQYEELTKRVNTFLEDLVLNIASENLNPEEVYATKLAAIKTDILAKLTEILKV